MKKLLLSIASLSLSTIIMAQSKGPVDSLAGFDFIGSHNHAGHAKSDMQKHHMMEQAKRNYINNKYKLHNQDQITNPNGERSSAEYYAKVKNGTLNNRGPGNNTMSQGSQPVGCTNVDFEANNTSGWTLTGDFQLMSGGTDPYGGFPCVYPGGGNYSLRLNDDNVNATTCSPPGSKSTFSASATRTIAVTPVNNQFQLHFAMVVLNFPHSSYDAARMKINFYDQFGNLLACPTYSCYYANPPGAFVGLPPGVPQNSPIQGPQVCHYGNYPVTYVPWQTVAVDLSSYNFTTVKVVINADWCLYQYDWAYGYVDADCGPTAPTTPVTSCTGLLNGPPGMVSYTWTPPVGPVVNTQTIMATTPGTYICGTTGFITCQPGKTYTYIVKPSPSPSFTNITSCLGAATSFTSTSTTNGGAGLTNYNWTWGDATPNANGGAFNTLSHTYATSGVFPVQLVVTNADGCKDSITQNVTVNGLPIVDFTFNNICEGAQTNFNNTTNTNGNTMSNWYWDFTTDGVMDNTTISPTLTYPTSGNFNVTLIGVTTTGCSDSIQKTVHVYSNPVSHFGFTRTCLGDYTNFWDNSYVIGNNGVINQWDWDLDGFPGSIEATGPNTNTIFQMQGNHVVGLTVTTSYGCKSTFTLNVYVNPIPVVDFTADKTAGCEKLPVMFTNNSYIPAGSITTYSWNVGDHTAAQSYTMQHTYPAGLYSVTLTAVSDSGCVATKIKPKYIDVWPTPVADYFANPQTSDVLEPIVNFNNTSAGYNHFWWYFGDISPVDSTHINPTHTYNDEVATSYMSTLIVQNQFGCSDTTQRLVVIDPAYVIYIPNAFTPNGDGLNDIFQAKGYYISKFDMVIYDRWGEQIFSSDDITKGWDGTVKGKTAENSVYVWKVIVVDTQKKRHDLTGHVTLMK
jgi:gliding motility-associated-like protein